MRWALQKRYNEFADFDKQMRVKHSQMPVLPPKTYFPLYYDKDIEDRRVKLSVYLQELMNRPDFRTAQIFRTFIELDAHADK